MDQWVGLVVTRPSTLSPIPETHAGEGERVDSNRSLTNIYLINSSENYKYFNIISSPPSLHSSILWPGVHDAPASAFCLPSPPCAARLAWTQSIHRLSPAGTSFLPSIYKALGVTTRTHIDTIKINTSSIHFNKTRRFKSLKASSYMQNEHQNNNRKFICLPFLDTFTGFFLLWP